MSIDTATLQRQITLMMAKLEQIAGIPKLRGNGADFSGIEFEDDGVTYKSETYFSGCGTDTFSFHTTWEELNNPIEYFQEKYAKEIEERKREDEEKKFAAQLKANDNERELAIQLKEKYKL